MANRWRVALWLAVVLLSIGGAGAMPSTTVRAALAISDPAARAASDLAALINNERQQRGIPPLQLDDRLVILAQRKAEDMAALGYVGHDSPTLGSPFAMLRDAGIVYAAAAENVAADVTVAAAHRALMQSPGHRRSILDDRFFVVGLGIAGGGPAGILVAELFVQPPAAGLVALD